jgi:hypothetical protein
MYDNFRLMYDCVYDQKVHAGVAAKLMEKIFRNMGGRIVDEEDTFGLPTEYVLTHPHMVVYVDKTGSNTNQKMDRHKKGDLFAVLVDQQEIDALGLAVDNHFTVLVFIVGTGKPIMVAVILYWSSLAIRSLPFGHWQTQLFENKGMQWMQV